MLSIGILMQNVSSSAQALGGYSGSNGTPVPGPGRGWGTLEGGAALPLSTVPGYHPNHLPLAPGSKGLQPRPLLGAGSCCWKGRHGPEGDKEVPIKLCGWGSCSQAGKSFVAGGGGTGVYVLHQKVEDVILCDPWAGGVHYRAGMKSWCLRALSLFLCLCTMTSPQTYEKSCF